MFSEDLLLGWSLPAEPKSSLSFEVASEMQDVMLWQREFSLNVPQAADQLTAIEQQAQDALQALNRLEADLDSVVLRSAAAEQAGVMYGLWGTDDGNSTQQALERLGRALTKLAWIETRVEGSLVGRSMIGWSGQTETFWGSGADPEMLVLHYRSLTAAVRSRLAVLRLVILTARAAAKIAALTAAPGGVLMALPFAWRTVRAALAELEIIKGLS